MGRSFLRIAFVALGLFSFAGCASYVPFTQELRSQHKLESGDLKNLQFYNSHEIRLRREVERGGGQVTPGHKLLVIAGKQIEEVVIEEHTPGVIVGVSETALKVSFEEGSFMEFSLRGPEPLSEPVVQRGRFAEPPNPFPGNDGARPAPAQPRLIGSGNFWLLPDGGSTVLFQGQSWELVGASTQSHLVISTESLEEVDEEETVLRGRKL
ncbi:MAG: DNA-directed RNA polymerase [Polyangiaceae bacterium]|nr:DNA-directed RNA polymerase [Polyangiaceae bacterium]